ncbi:MAG: BrxA family protein, partial [Coriobacteriales bacterium]
MPSDYSLSMSGASLRRPESLITARLYLENHDWKQARRQIIDDDLYQLNAVS